MKTKSTSSGKPLTDTFRLVGIEELGRLLSLSPSAIRYHVRCGRITPIRGLGRRVLFDLEAVRDEITRGSEPRHRSVARCPRTELIHSGHKIFESRIEDEVGFSEKEKTK